LLVVGRVIDVCDQGAMQARVKGTETVLSSFTGGATVKTNIHVWTFIRELKTLPLSDKQRDDVEV
jgi:hypothetical protein